jgi:hypothetical protein
MGAKYDPLRLHLRASWSSSIVFTFSEIEKVLGDFLPPIAKSHPEWWANETNPHSRHVQCHAWREAGYSAHPNLTAETVTFRRSPN